MNYNDFKVTIFDIYCNSSRTLITKALHMLSQQFDTHYNQCVKDFNEYTYNMWEIEYEWE